MEKTKQKTEYQVETEKHWETIQDTLKQYNVSGDVWFSIGWISRVVKDGMHDFLQDEYIQNEYIKGGDV